MEDQGNPRNAPLPNQELALARRARFRKLLQEDSNSKAKKNYVANDLLAQTKSCLNMSGFNCLQVLIHKKGTNFTHSYFFDIFGSTKYSIVNYTRFNSLFRQVKKSRNKKFKMESDAIDFLHFIGTYAAKAKTDGAYSSLIILSRQGFLPIQDDEYESLDHVDETILPMLFEKLNAQEATSKTRLLKEFFENYYCNLFIDGVDILSCEQDQKPTSYQIIRDVNDSISYLGNFQHHRRVQLLGDLLNSLSHELCNPIFGIHIYSENLIEAEDRAEVRDILTDIHKSADRCQEIIKESINFYTPHQTEKNISIAAIIDEVFRLTKSETRNIRKIINFYSCNKTITISTNPTMFSQILFNLILNSAQAMRSIPESSKEINISIERVTPQKVSISISDAGTGISKDKSELIFTPFYTTKSDGTGLGLTICSMLANQLGAKLFLDESSKNTTFVLEIPQ